MTVPPKCLRRRVSLALFTLGAAVLLALAGFDVAHSPVLPPEARPEFAPQADLSEYNVLIVTIDALRADHLGCYGYTRATSPFIDSLAAQGVLFEEAMSNSSFTCESIAALLTGLLPSLSGTGAGWWATPSPASTNLAGHFANAGYATGLFTDHPALHDPRFDDGFAENDHLEKHWGKSGNGPKLSRRALEFARKHSDAKTLMYLHYLDPHGPYRPSEEAYLRFADSVFPEPLALYSEVRPKLAELVDSGFGPGDARFEDLVLRYDAEIFEVDGAIRILLDGLKEIGVLDKTLVILSADHGEEFLDHGYVEHAWRLYRESIHVPLIFWAPGILDPARISDRVSLVDILPTVLGIAGIGHERNALSGTAFYERRDETLRFVPPAKPLISELLLQTRGLVRTVIAGDCKYMAAQRWLTPAQCSEAAKVQQEVLDAIRKNKVPPLHTWGPVVHEEFYNIAEDPLEQRDTITSASPELERMRSLLADYRDACGGTSPGEEAPEQVTAPSEQMEEMESLGYL